MSYEGYVQLLCAKGHLTEIDCYEDIPEKCHCGRKFVWRNGVDTTNGSYDDNGNRIDGAVELEISKEIKCKHCGHGKEIIYRIPKGDKNENHN